VRCLTRFSGRLLTDKDYTAAYIAPMTAERALMTISIASITACLGLILLATSAEAQTIEPIYSFANGSGNPRGGNLVLGPDGNLYGTTKYGGTNGGGTVFKVTTGGVLTVLANFGGLWAGALPYGGVTLGPDGNLYGTTQMGGSNAAAGTVFRVTTNGVLTTLYSFRGSNGANPTAAVTLAPDGYLYGTTQWGGANSNGTVFKMTTNGILTTLFSFDAAVASGNGTTNATGACPQGGLTWAPDGNLYGTASGGGSAAVGTFFRVTTNGAFTMLLDFAGSGVYGSEFTLALGPDGCLYGTSTSLSGTVFKVTTNGVLTTLVKFTNRTGISPQAGVTFGPDGNLYGTTTRGLVNYGTFDGTVFQLTTNGVLTTLARFSDANCSDSEAGVTFGPDGYLYGTTSYGGPNGGGVIYRLILRPTLSINRSARGAVMLNLASMPGSTNRLWATTDLSLPMADWEVLATNVATNGILQFADPNTSGAQAKFYRLSTP
jgi:uncharacterized repeat protein (TIGR03803 family)